jgi:hypothetical protein
MNTHLHLAVDIELQRRNEQAVLLISFHREALQDWCLGLCLLHTGLIGTLVITGRRRNMMMKLHFGTNAKGDRVARATLRPDASEVELTHNGLDYLQQFFLKYYRDGVAEVDHLDLEAIDAVTGKKNIYVTFRVPNSTPPVSPEEAARRLHGEG